MFDALENPCNQENYQFLSQNWINLFQHTSRFMPERSLMDKHKMRIMKTEQQCFSSVADGQI